MPKSTPRPRKGTRSVRRYIPLKALDIASKVSTYFEAYLEISIFRYIVSDVCCSRFPGILLFFMLTLNEISMSQLSKSYGSYSLSVSYRTRFSFHIQHNVVYTRKTNQHILSRGGSRSMKGIISNIAAESDRAYYDSYHYYSTTTAAATTTINTAIYYL